MALNDPPATLETRLDSGDSECEVEEEELDKLESDVKQMAQKILEYRTKLPDQLKNSFTSILLAQRPVVLGNEPESETGSSGENNSDSVGRAESTEGTTTTLGKMQQQRTAEKIRLLKDKISSNVSVVPTVLKRMRECISRIDKLDSHNGIIHPAFKKRKL